MPAGSEPPNTARWTPSSSNVDAAGPPTTYRLDSDEALTRLAENLAYDFDDVHALALTDANGLVLDGVLLSDPAHTIDHTIGFALCLALSLDVETLCATFVSVVPASTVSSTNAYTRSWRTMNDVLSAAVHVRDWIITDGASIHSMTEVS
ncbi:MAG: hypothetical protein ACR2PK_19190 [Acidimicrobiales bacterium]